MNALGAYGTDWLYLAVPVALYVVAVAYLVASGTARDGGPLLRAWRRAGSSLERLTGLPAWCAGGIGTGAFALVIAVTGFYWDVAWHIDLGRDEFVFTPAHTMILTGLALIPVSAFVATVFATIDRAPVGRRIGALTVPHAALALYVLGFGALAGFPLDEMWHGAYGVDVTMWGPTHILMILGASLSTVAYWLLAAEAGAAVRRPTFATAAKVLLAGATMVGLSTMQGEFDFGVPQFQQLYHPVLIALAAALGLIAARVGIGRGGALMAAAAFIAIRAVLALVIGEALHLTVPRFPLYLGAALVAEVVATRLPGLVAGSAVGAAALASEWAVTAAWGRHPWGTSLVPDVAVALIAGAAAGPVAMAAGRVLALRAPETSRRLLAGCALAIAISLALPLPRTGAPIDARVTTEAAGRGRAHVGVALDPPDAAAGADWFEILSWQGGSMLTTSLRRTGPGRFETTSPVPVNGHWKTIVRIARADVLVALPVYMPADHEIGASEVPAEPSRRASFVPDSAVLLREAHAGPAWPAIVAYAVIAAVALAWIAALARAYAGVGASHGRRTGRGGGAAVRAGAPLSA